MTKVNHDTVLANVFAPAEMKRKSIRLFGCDLHLSEIQGCLIKGSTKDGDGNNASAPKDHVKNKNSKYYRCKFCDRLYTTSQALGGHQNAHRQERMFRKKLQHEAKKASIDDYLRSLQSSPFLHRCQVDDGVVPSNSVGESLLGFDPMYYQSYKYDSLVLDSCGLQVHVPY